MRDEVVFWEVADSTTSCTDRAGLTIRLSMSLAHMQTNGQLQSRPQEPMRTGLRLFWLQYVNVHWANDIIIAQGLNY